MYLYIYIYIHIYTNTDINIYLQGKQMLTNAGLKSINDFSKIRDDANRYKPQAIKSWAAVCARRLFKNQLTTK